MHSVELLACQIDEPLADALARWATPHGVWLRRLAAPDAVLNLLRGGSRGVVVLRLGRDLTRELETLRAAITGFPGIHFVVLGEVEHPELEGLVYDLDGAPARSSATTRSIGCSPGCPSSSLPDRAEPRSAVSLAYR